MLRGLIRIAAVLGIAWGGWQALQQRELERAPGVLAPREPKQVELDGSRIIRKGDYELTALASYDIEARLLRRESYHADASAPLSPLDFALGWGPMSDSAVLARLDITQGNRFYYYHWDNGPPIPAQTIAETSANTHLIPATDSVFAKLDTVRPGQVVHLRGYLVSVRGPKDFTWRSSLTRADSGAGACEVFYVESVQVD